MSSVLEDNEKNRLVSARIDDADADADADATKITTATKDIRVVRIFMFNPVLTKVNFISQLDSYRSS